MVSSDGSDVNARKRKRSQYSIHPAHQPEGIPGIALDVVTHILGTDYYLPDPADIASLREVSRGMCDAVDETGRSLQMFGAHEAAERGHLSTLKHLHRQGLMRFTAEVCAKGAGSGNLELLKWMRENGCPWDKFTCSAAAHGGQLEVLQWARANRCPWDEYTCTCAARRGNLQLLQWLRANGCPWDTYTCAWAAEGGHLEVLQWARANGCPWCPQTCELAAEKGHLDILKWARMNGCPMDEEAFDKLALAVGRFVMCAWKSENGVLSELAHLVKDKLF